MNRINLLQSVWESGAWLMCDIVALSYPLKLTPQSKTLYRNFLESLTTMLPSHEARTKYLNYDKKFKQWEHALVSRQSLVEWLTTVKNTIKVNPNIIYTVANFYNCYKDKKVGIVELDKIFLFVESFCLSCTNEIPEKVGLNFTNFIALLPYLNLEEEVIENIKDYFAKNVLDDNILTSKCELTIWVIGLHNRIRKLYNKNNFRIEDLLAIYQ